MHKEFTSNKNRNCYLRETPCIRLTAMSSGLQLSCIRDCGRLNQAVTELQLQQQSVHEQWTTGVVLVTRTMFGPVMMTKLLSLDAN